MQSRAPLSTVVAAFLVLIVAAFTIGVPPSHAANRVARDCAQAVIDDWYGDSQVDQRYPLHCYRDAIASLTTEQKDYLHAEEDILRALAYARVGKKDPGAAAALGVKPTSHIKPTPTPKPPEPTPSRNPQSSKVTVDDVPAGDAASFPLPLLVLGGLAAILLGAGGVGVISRRLRASRDSDPS